MRKPLGAQIALARVRENREETFSAAEFLREDATCLKDRAGGNAAKDAFLLRKTMSAGGGFFIGYGHNPVEDSSIQHLGNETGADTLNLVHPRLSTGQNR